VLTPEENEMMTRVGPGTPAGDMLRRYWWPVGFSAELTSKPVLIRLLGENLVMFRDGQGRVGILEQQCTHRLVSLEYGRVEDRGLRCCYHGWLYDVEGRCLEQPLEPADSTFKDRVRQPAYRAAEAAGLVFAYIGPEPAPPLPRYDLLCKTSGRFVVGAEEIGCNWLQRVENVVDEGHVPFLHASDYPDLAFRIPTLDWQRTDYGSVTTMTFAGDPEPVHFYFLFPAHNRLGHVYSGETPSQTIRMRTPIDDGRTAAYWVRWYPTDDGRQTIETVGMRKSEPGVYSRVDDPFWGIASRDQDRVAMESQGAICDRGREHLATSDRGVIMLREMVMEAIKTVQAGGDPLGVVRGAAADRVLEFDATELQRV